MKAAGIICEYNPFHRGHGEHIEKTRARLDGNCAIVCAMSGNFVQRGDYAVFNKHARAAAAIRGGADLVIEIPTPYALKSAEGFAAAGVHLLGMLSVCDYLSFGSESGDIGALREASDAIGAIEAGKNMKDLLGKGISYAAARQKAAEAELGKKADILKAPNNMLGIEYLRALSSSGFDMEPLTFARVGSEHDGAGCCASALRKMLHSGQSARAFIPGGAAEAYEFEMDQGRGPVSMAGAELAILSRLRRVEDFSGVQGVSEGLEHRLRKYSSMAPTIEDLLGSLRTKRYPMSRMRRVLLCACLGLGSEDAALPPPYIRVLGMNEVGMKLLSAAKGKAQLPIIIKPAHALRCRGKVSELMLKESDATDFYALAYPCEQMRRGGSEWQSPAISASHRSASD